MQPHISCREETSLQIQSPIDTPLEVYVSGWVRFLEDSPLGLKPRSIVKRFMTQLNNEYVITCKAYVSLYNDFVRFIGVARSEDRLTESILSAARKTPIFKEILSAIRTKDTHIVTYVESFLRFGKKTVMPETQDLEEAALRGWYEVEERLSSFVVPEWAPACRAILKGFLTSSNPYHDLSFDHEVLPYHGNGRVAERGLTTREQKDKNLRVRKSMLLAFLTQQPARRFIPERGRVVIVEDPPARVKFVRKDQFSVRGICLEPSGIQWGQQSVRLSLERFISRSPAGRFINLRDQTMNQDAGRAGSALRHIDTIDLEKASDSVSYDLVRSVFPSSIFKWLAVTRSKSVELPDGNVVRPLKFAPMGSACAFPVQSLIYLCVVLVAYHEYVFGHINVTYNKGGTLWELLDLIEDDPEKVSITGMHTLCVYGDDIVCDGRVTEKVISMLEQACFRVNVKKSFIGDIAYRETCGGFYLHGRDVSGMSFKPDATEGQMNGPLLASLIDAANRAHDLGYAKLRETILWFLHFRSHRGKGLLRKPRPLEYSDRGIRGCRPSFSTRGKIKTKHRSSNPVIRRETERVITLKVVSDQNDIDPVSGLIGYYRRTVGSQPSKSAWYSYLPKGSPSEEGERGSDAMVSLCWRDVFIE